MKHFDTYYYKFEGMLVVVYGNGHSDNAFNSIMILIWPEGYWL